MKHIAFVFVVLLFFSHLGGNKVESEAAQLPPPPVTGNVAKFEFPWEKKTPGSEVFDAIKKAQEEQARQAAIKAEAERVAAEKARAEQPVAEQVQQAPVEAPQQLSGCTTYHSSNYALEQLMQHESTFYSCAENAGHCFGLLQACPGAPLKAACGGDPECQIAWFQANKTGGRSWEAIWALWQTQGYW